jgi:hypothetical protein
LTLLAAALWLSRALAAPERPSAAAAKSNARVVQQQRARVLGDDVAVWTLPSVESPRRGTLVKDAILPVLERSPTGAGCPEPWLRVASEAWVCGNQLATQASTAMTGSATSAAASNTLLPYGGLPYRYYFVGSNGSFGYSSLGLADEGIPDSQLEPGFAVAVTEVHQKPSGESFGLTTHGLWLPLRDLRPALSSSFTGYQFVTSTDDVGWIFESNVRVREKPSPSGKHAADIDRLSLVRIRREEKRGGASWLEIGEQRWVRSSSVRRWRVSALPAGVGADEHWIDIDLERQILTTYAGSRPEFATLVSSGKGRGDSPEATPLGQHRIWVKLLTRDMTNLEDLTQLNVYALEEVPWVMFFEQGYGLHAAFWHDSFGNRRSHGCVNLSPHDAETVFRWATPSLPVGFSAILPTANETGTLVLVR